MAALQLLEANLSNILIGQLLVVVHHVSAAISSVISLFFIVGLVGLSEQELLDCGWNFGLQSCRGGSVDRAFRYIAQIGLSTENSYVYSGTANRCCGSSQGYTGVPSQEGQGMQAFCDLNPMNESELVGALQFQPVAVGLAVDEEFMSYKGGILNSKAGSTDG